MKFPKLFKNEAEKATAKAAKAEKAASRAKAQAEAAEKVKVEAEAAKVEAEKKVETEKKAEVKTEVTDKPVTDAELRQWMHDLLESIRTANNNAQKASWIRRTEATRNWSGLCREAETMEQLVGVADLARALGEYHFAATWLEYNRSRFYAEWANQQAPVEPVLAANGSAQ
jgi:hypothetical protein